MSSTTTPDIASICQELIGRDVASALPIGQGRNSRVFLVTLTRPSEERAESVVLKFYRHDPWDNRDRLGVEFNGLRFLWQNGVRAIPRTIAADRDHYCAAYEYIPGEVVAAGDVASGDIDAAVDFLASLSRLRGSPGSDGLSTASEAYFTIDDVVGSVRARLIRLQAAGTDSEQGRQLHTWVDRHFAPLLDDVERWIGSVADAWSIERAAPLPSQSRTISPSDFGFHNTIRRTDGSLAFVDFEYFGWDDPAKTLVDYLLHPGMALAESLKHRFAKQFLTAFSDVPLLTERARIVYPLFGLKWCLIMLNDFLPERHATSSRERRAGQLEKARAMAERISHDYTANPYVVSAL